MSTKKVLVIGGHGRVALRALPLLSEAGHEVSALIRKPEYEPDIIAAGASPVGAEMLAFDESRWDDLLADYDVIVWAAGNGARQGPDQTFAIDRDAAIASIESAKRQSPQPRYLMVSFATSLVGDIDPQAKMGAYRQAKREADLHLQDSGLDYAILGPGLLTDDDVTNGLERVGQDSEQAASGTTSRQLVAEVIAYLVGVEKLPEDRFIAFMDGDAPVSSLR